MGSLPSLLCNKQQECFSIVSLQQKLYTVPKTSLETSFDWGRTLKLRNQVKVLSQVLFRPSWTKCAILWYRLQLANVMYGSMLSLMRQRTMTLSIYSAMDNSVILRPKWKTLTANDTHAIQAKRSGGIISLRHTTLNWDKARISKEHKKEAEPSSPASSLSPSIILHNSLLYSHPLHHSILHCSLSRSPIDERRLLVTLRSACVRTPA